MSGLLPGQAEAIVAQIEADLAADPRHPRNFVPYDGPLPEEPPADDYDYAVAEDRETRWRTGA